MERIGDLILEKPLDKGNYGIVYLSRKDNSDTLYATKKINKPKTNEEKKFFETETKIMRELNHPNVIKLIDLKMGSNYYYIVMELANGGDLKSCLKKYMSIYNTPFPEEIVQYLMKQIVSAIAYIHSMNVIHRDLKLENIMVNFDSDIDKQNLNMMKAKVKIIDFGCSIVIPSQNNFCFTALGTPGYMDPLLLKEYYYKEKRENLKGYGKEVDIWSLGCLCFELFRGKVPFTSGTFEDLINKHDEGKYNLLKDSSTEIKYFLSKMLKRDGKARATAQELLNHPFLTKDSRTFCKINTAPQINNNQNLYMNYKRSNSSPITYNPYNNNNNQIMANVQPQPPKTHAIYQLPGNVPNYQVPGYNNNYQY